LLVGLRWSEWDNFTTFSFLFFFLSKRFDLFLGFIILFISWWIVNESSVSLDLSVNSNGVLLVLRFIEIFSLSSSNIFVAGFLERFLLLDGIKNFF
jgi:hypothetical protein